MAQDKDNLPLTLLDLGYKKAGPVRIYDQNSLDDDGSIIPFTDQLAIVTHYAMLQGSKFGRVFEQKASSFIESWTQNIPKKQLGDYGDLVAEPIGFQTYLFAELFKAPFPGPEKPKFTFIDLFAGIGGFRMALQNLGGSVSMVKQTIRQGVRFDYLLVDSWFTCAELIQLIHRGVLPRMQEPACLGQVPVQGLLLADCHHVRCHNTIHVLAFVKRFEAYETIGGLFRLMSSQSLELTIAERVWQLMTDLLSSISELVDMDTDQLIEANITENEKINCFLAALFCRDAA